MAVALPYKSYETTLENLQETLNENGVAVIPNVFSAEQIQDLQERMWALLGRLTRKMGTHIERDNPSTWSGIEQLKPINGMLLHGCKVRHSQIAWDVRQNPTVANAFSQIWACNPEELLSSFDGMSICLPPEPQMKAGDSGSKHAGGRKYVDDDGFYNGSDWFHVDQNLKNTSFECVQGLVNIFDVHPGDGTLAIYEGSHKCTQDLVDFYPELLTGGSFVPINQEQREFLQSFGCRRYNVECPAGSLVVWDSRTVHCGCLPQRGRTHTNPRFVVYVCEMPRQMFGGEVLERKRTLFEAKRMTGHWPDGRNVFGERGSGLAVEMPDPQLTPLGRRLAGLE